MKRMAIPANAAPLWEALKGEVQGIYLYWINFRQLFGKGKERVDLLNRIAGEFFYVAQDVLMNDIQMSLSKLADPAVSVRRPNASLQRLVDELTATDPRLLPELTAKLDVYRDRCRDIKVRRNKQLSHFDLSTLLASHGQAAGAPLIGPSRQEIEQALEALRDFMNSVARHFDESEISYRQLITKEDGESLVQMLKQGLRYQELQESGEIKLDDLRKLDGHDA